MARSGGGKKAQLAAQRDWKAIRHELGLCVRCGMELNHYKWRCDACQLKARQNERRRLGLKKWVPGGVGRRPRVMEDLCDGWPQVG